MSMKFNKKWKVFFQEYAFQNAFKMSAILFRLQYVKLKKVPASKDLLPSSQ